MRKALLLLMLVLSQPAAACGVAGVISFWLVGGPLVPFIAIGISHRVGRRLLPSTELRVIAFLLSVPATAIGIRLGFETLFVFDTLLFGPLVLVGTTLLACMPPVFLSWSPARRLMVRRSPFERVLLATPMLFVTMALTYYGLGFGAKTPVPQGREPKPFVWNRLQESIDGPRVTIDGIGLGMRFDEIGDIAGRPIAAWLHSTKERRNVLATEAELTRLAASGLLSLPGVHTVCFESFSDSSSLPSRKVEVQFDTDGRAIGVWGDRLEIDGAVVADADSDAKSIPRIRGLLPNFDDVRDSGLEKSYFYRSVGLRLDFRPRMDLVDFSLHARANVTLGGE